MNEGKRADFVERMVSGTFWVSVVALVTGILVLLRGSLDKAHIVLAYLIIVLLGSSVRGRQIGLLLAFTSFLAFNYFLLQPLHTFVIADPRDWLILITYLATCLIAAELFQRAQSQTIAAASRASEIEHLSMVGSETINAGRAEDGVAAVARVIRVTLKLDEAVVYGISERGLDLLSSSGGDMELPDHDLEIIRRVGEDGIAAVQNRVGTWRVLDDTRDVLEQAGSNDLVRLIILPLVVRSRIVGVLKLFAEKGIPLDSHERRFARALAYYAALGVDRVHLAREVHAVEALKEADRMKDALLASVSHDLRAPLTTIKALAHDLRRNGDENAAIIESEADRLNALVVDLLDLSRINGGALRLRPEPNAADDLLSSALDRLSGHPRAGDIHAKVVGADLLLGHFDFSHSLRALVNLIDNALKYSPAGSVVQVRVKRDGDFLYFEVCDEGTGIPDGYERDIFTPFFRAPDVEPDAHGTGLGLPIARKLAVEQGGDILYARSPEGGSRFTLILPAIEAPPEI